MLGYKHKFIQADIKNLHGKDFQGYDVIWGSPPCRDFSVLGVANGHLWKRKPDPEFGLLAVNSFLQFIKDATPRYWIMENVARAKLFVPLKPVCVTNLNKGKKHALWGNFPIFLIPKTNEVFYTIKTKSGKRVSKYHNDHKLRSWKIAKLPIACTSAFAHACKEALESQYLLASESQKVNQP
jgi:hypothetical protein